MGAAGGAERRGGVWMPAAWRSRCTVGVMAVAHARVRVDGCRGHVDGDGRRDRVRGGWISAAWVSQCTVGNSRVHVPSSGKRPAPVGDAASEELLEEKRAQGGEM